MDLRSTIGELYALLPEQFTAARNAKVRAALGEGDKELAKHLKALKRPSASAWLLNLLVRERGTRLREVLELGAGLRQAQANLDMGHLRELMKQQRSLIAQVVTEGRDCAAQSGHPVSDAVAREVEQTLRAAMTDVGAAAAVRSGQLVAALVATGLEAVEVSAAVGDPSVVDWEVAGGTGAPASSAETKHSTAKKPETSAEAAGLERQGRELAERRLRKAERTAASAADALARARKKARELAARQVRLEDEVAVAGRQLRDLERQSSEAERDLRAAERAREKAEAAEDSAQRALEHARHAVENLTR